MSRLDENASATFLSSRNGTFLNQAILCLTAVPPPCPTPIVSSLDTVTGSSETTSAPVLFRGSNRRDAEAITSLVGGRP